MAKTSFDKRVEMKYLLDDCTYHVYKNRISDIMRPDDAFPESRIYNIYYDTPDHLLVRRSLDKPLYKEKLRLRTYGLPESGNADSFIEIKKKYKGIVYKRRIRLPYDIAYGYLSEEEYGSFYAAAEKILSEGNHAYHNLQVLKEIDYFKQIYTGLSPAMIISYHRYSFEGVDDPELRMTFDTDICYRTDKLTLLDSTSGSVNRSAGSRQMHTVTDAGSHLMEIKVPGAFPIKLAHTLNELGIQKTSFSKYGAAYVREYFGQTDTAAGSSDAAYSSTQAAYAG